jgi:hypothetical protein
MPYSVTNNRILLQKTVESKREPELFRFSTSDAALLHGTLVLAANSWARVCGGERAQLEPILYQHKTEAIRIVNERLGERIFATTDGTVGAIACLTIFEVGVHTCSPVSIQKIDEHLRPGTQWSCSCC